MAELAPLLKRKKSIDSASETQKCLICNDPCLEKQKLPANDHWENFRRVAEEWKKTKGTDTEFVKVFDKVCWEHGPEGHFWHKDCKWKMCNKKTLEQAKRSAKKSNDLSCNSQAPESTSLESDPPLMTRHQTGIIHDKNLCVWCMTEWDGRHTDEPNFRQMRQLTTWYKFKASVFHVSDLQKRRRLRMLVDSTVDPIAAQICYHVKCFKKYGNIPILLRILQSTPDFV